MGMAPKIIRMSFAIEGILLKRIIRSAMKNSRMPEIANIGKNHEGVRNSILLN